MLDRKEASALLLAVVLFTFANSVAIVSFYATFDLPPLEPAIYAIAGSLVAGIICILTILAYGRPPDRPRF